MSTRQHWFGGHTPWTLSIENGVKVDCQRSITKSGYTCFLQGVNFCQWRLATHQHWFGGHTLWTLSMTNSDKVDCQRSITKSGYTSFSIWVVNVASQNQDIHLLLTGLQVFYIKNVNTSTRILGSYPLNLEHGKYCIRRLPRQHRKNRIYYFLWPGHNCCHLRMSTCQH